MGIRIQAGQNSCLERKKHVEELFVVARGFWILNVLCRGLKRFYRFFIQNFFFVFKNLGLDLDSDTDPDLASISLDIKSAKCLDPDPKQCW